MQAIHLLTQSAKIELYELILPQIQKLVKAESDLVANLSNTCAILKETFNFFWVGFYLLKQNDLVLGPFQGPLACTRIPLDKGICGMAYREKRTILVSNVHLLNEHIACNKRSQSEIVVPMIYEKRIPLVLDIDSDTLDTFDEIDKSYLENLINVLARSHFASG